MFGPMFYNIVKLVLVLAILFSCIMVLGIFSGWIGFGYVLFTIKTVLISFGLYIFYKTRLSVKRTNLLHKNASAITHFLILPVVIFAIFTMSNENLSQHYWFYLNALLVLFTGIATIDLFAATPMKSPVKALLILIILTITTLLILHMSGKFENGSVILYAIAALFLLGTIFTFTALQKRR